MSAMSCLNIMGPFGGVFTTNVIVSYVVNYKYTAFTEMKFCKKL